MLQAFGLKGIRSLWRGKEGGGGGRGEDLGVTVNGVGKPVLPCGGVGWVVHPPGVEKVTLPIVACLSQYLKTNGHLELTVDGTLLIFLLPLTTFPTARLPRTIVRANAFGTEVPSPLSIFCPRTCFINVGEFLPHTAV